jgi:hypothetical protein
MVAGCLMLLGFAARMPWRRRSQLLLSVIRRGQTRVRASLPLTMFALIAGVRQLTRGPAAATVPFQSPTLVHLLL